MSELSTQALIDFVYAECRMLDEKQFDAWWDLFTDDAYYWMPLERGQTNAELGTSLYHDDKLLLKLRIERLKRPRSFSQHPASYCHHLLQLPTVEVSEPENNHYVVRAAFNYTEVRGDEQVQLAGWSHYSLSDIDGQIKITHKKVELLNCESALPSIQLFI